jgi:hypothetical protein
MRAYTGKVSQLSQLSHEGAEIQPTQWNFGKVFEWNHEPQHYLHGGRETRPSGI